MIEDRIPSETDQGVPLGKGVLGSGGESPLERSGATGADCAAPACVQGRCPDALAEPLEAKTAEFGVKAQGDPPPCQIKGSGDVRASSEPESHPWVEKTDKDTNPAQVSVRVKGADGARGMDARSASDPGSGGALGGAAALPCQNSNNSALSAKRYRLKAIPGTDYYRQKGNDKAVWRKIDGDLIQRYGMPTSNEAKAAYHLRKNVESFVAHYGRNHCLFFTITDEKTLHPTVFARCWNRFMRRAGSWIKSFIRTLEPQKNGRPHYHLIIAVAWDTRPDDFDWKAFFDCQAERASNGPSALFRSLRAAYKASAASELVALWSFLRKVLPRFGFGRAELLPMRKGQEAISEYIGKYLEAGLIMRRHSWKGARRVEFDRSEKSNWLACTRVFAWNSTGARAWRSRVRELADAVGATDMNGLKKSSALAGPIARGMRSQMPPQRTGKCFFRCSESKALDSAPLTFMLTLLKFQRKKYRTVEFYRAADGTKPVADWLNQLDDERAQAVAVGVRYFEEYPNPVVPTKFFEKITDHIWEIKTHYGKEQFRLLAFVEDGAIIIAVHGFAKKSMDLKKQEVELAEERRKDYLRRKKQ